GAPPHGTSPPAETPGELRLSHSEPTGGHESTQPVGCPPPGSGANNANSAVGEHRHHRASFAVFEQGGSVRYPTLFYRPFANNFSPSRELQFPPRVASAFQGWG